MNRNLPVWYLCVLMLTLLLLVSCKKKQEENSIVKPTSAECPIGTIPSEFSDIDPSAKTYPLPKGFFNEFIKYAHQYEGTHITIPSQTPEEWVLLYRENAPANQELWLVQSADKDWTYLVVTAGQHVRDALPIAVDLATPGDVIESEIWTWQREEDGAFLVTKHYEKRPNAKDTTQHQIHTDAVERYVMSEVGQFKCIPLRQIEGTPYQAVILFNLSSDRPEKWFDVMNDIAPYCEDNNYYFVVIASAQEDLHKVDILDYQSNFITTVDISQLVEDMEQGIVLLQNGAEPRVENFSSTEGYLQMKIRNYFNSNSNLNL